MQLDAGEGSSGEGGPGIRGVDAVELPDGLLQLVSVEKVSAGVVGGGGRGRVGGGGGLTRSGRGVEALLGRVFGFLMQVVESSHPLFKNIFVHISRRLLVLWRPHLRLDWPDCRLRVVPQRQVGRVVGVYVVVVVVVTVIVCGAVCVVICVVVCG